MITENNLLLKIKKFKFNHKVVTVRYRGIICVYWALINRNLTNQGVILNDVHSRVDTGLINAV